jgi:hypothetical protein
MNTEIFKTFTIDDFILDEDFREIVQNSDSSDRLNDLLERFPEKRREINLAIQVIRGLEVKKFHQPYHRKKELWQQIIHFQKKQIRFFYFKVAASILLLIGFGSATFYLTKQVRIDRAIVANIPPPSDNATLILANGKTVSISSKQSTVKYSSDGSGILVNDSSVIADSVSDDRLNQLIVPYGKHSYILLSEGTRVWLNSGSKLVFPSIFKGNTREVYLEGEAFFEVASNEQKPFYVKTDAFKTKVYGTKFVIQAYKLDNAYSIVLVEGKVSMNVNKNSVSQEIFLTPNQKATITKGKEIFEIVNVENTDLYTAWVEGYLTFSNTEVADLLKRVSRYYNITIEMELTDDVEKIYGKLDLKDNCDRVLDGIAFISKTKYEKRGNKYVFMSN